MLLVCFHDFSFDKSSTESLQDQIINKGIPHAYIPGSEYQTAFLSSSTPGNWHLGDYWGLVADESRGWLDHLSRNCPCPIATAREARQTLEITLPIEESARTGKAVTLAN